MRKLTTCLLAMVLTVFVFGSASAQSTFEGRGSAIVTAVEAINDSHNNTSNEIFITNITGSTVTCKVTFYDQNGNDVTEISNYCRVMTGSDSSSGLTTVASGTGTFDLPPFSTRMVLYRYTSSQSKHMMGHAVIEWTSQDSRLRKALTAKMRYSRFTSTQGWASSSPINGGQPF